MVMTCFVVQEKYAISRRKIAPLNRHNHSLGNLVQFFVSLSVHSVIYSFWPLKKKLLGVLLGCNDGNKRKSCEELL